MKKFIYIITILTGIITVGTTAARAQANPVAPFGMLVGVSGFGTDDLINYSQNTGSFNTARSAAMGGAFTSLGGDLVSIGLNPAGLGMYRTSAWGFTPSITYSGMDNDFKAYSNGKTRFAPNNIGVVFNTTQRSRGLVSFSLGLSYNKAADFNYSTGIRFPVSEWSLLDIFSLQLNGVYGYVNSNSNMDNPKKWEGSAPSSTWKDTWNNLNIDQWGAGLAYNNGAFQMVNDQQNAGVSKYHNSSVGPGVDITPSLRYDSKGSIREWNVSGGMNFNNVFYLGFGLTFQDIYQSQIYSYREYFDYSNSGTSEKGSYLRQMEYNQYTEASGSGVNFKVGIIARPVAGLRIGAAVHTPTFTTLRHSYYASMDNDYYGFNNNSSGTTIRNEYDYPYNSPTRLMFGASYTFGDYAVISADYERKFYSGMRLKSDELEMNDWFREDIKAYYRSTNNFRVGAEFKPIPMLALRAGYSFYDSPLKPGEDVAIRFIPTTSHSISAGLGFRPGPNVMIDFAYIFSMTDFAKIMPYYYEGDFIEIKDDGSWDAPEWKVVRNGDLLYSGIKQNRHTFTLSFNFLF